MTTLQCDYEPKFSGPHEELVLLELQFWISSILVIFMFSFLFLIIISTGPL